MRKVIVFILTATLLMGSGYAMAQQSSETQTPQPGQAAPEVTTTGAQEMPQIMQKLHDTMQQMQQMMSKDKKMSAVDLRKMQDMLNQMQGMMNQMHMMYMMHGPSMMKTHHSPEAHPPVPPEQPKKP